MDSCQTEMEKFNVKGGQKFRSNGIQKVKFAKKRINQRSIITIFSDIYIERPQKGLFISISFDPTRFSY